MVKKISQAEARRLKKRVAELESANRARFNRYTSSYPGGIHLRSLSLNDVVSAELKTAQKLKHALVLRHYGDNIFYVYAVAGPQ